MLFAPTNYYFDTFIMFFDTRIYLKLRQTSVSVKEYSFVYYFNNDSYFSHNLVTHIFWGFIIKNNMIDNW